MREQPAVSFSIKRRLIRLERELQSMETKVKNAKSSGSLYGIDSKLPIVKAVLVLEDRSFFRHYGFDWKSIFRAIKRFFKGRGFGGASTIDQQVVRIISERYERTISRKLKETIKAVLLNARVSKQCILLYYLNNSYFGYRLVGVEATSKHIFGSAARELDRDQACFVASLLPLPLPKKVYVSLLSDCAKPVTPEEVISISQKFSPRWADRVNYRYRHARASIDRKIEYPRD